eukprot:CAMPEP_0182536334 /NCGR_PEP_ID=MMETSP1323-20130603/19807_1 /TAXON_ID=236787 /ORGANISM="Florenciella parvula, Strain RCC1693" /LENGTH=596 /DNA_ID=CAMNT_0024746559 /DNA_START=78 /DNA_END=1868 /DNA_ORIENTATION=-
MGNDIGREQNKEAKRGVDTLELIRLNNKGWRLLKGGSDLEGALKAYSAALSIKPSYKLAQAGQNYAAAAIAQQMWNPSNTIPHVPRRQVRTGGVDFMVRLYLEAAELWEGELGAGHEAPRMARAAAARVRRNLRANLQQGEKSAASADAASPPPPPPGAPFWITNPQGLVGRRIAVLWSGGKLYEGKVASYDPTLRKHTVVYDDGDNKSYKMCEKTFWILGRPTNPADESQYIKYEKGVASSVPPPAQPAAAQRSRRATSSTHTPTAAAGQDPATHFGVTCDKSGMNPIVGVRYHVPHADYDLCEAEFAKLPEAEHRKFVKIERPGASWSRLHACAWIKPNTRGEPTSDGFTHSYYEERRAQYIQALYMRSDGKWVATTTRAQRTGNVVRVATSLRGTWTASGGPSAKAVGDAADDPPAPTATPADEEAAEEAAALAKVAAAVLAEDEALAIALTAEMWDEEQEEGGVTSATFGSSPPMAVPDQPAVADVSSSSKEKREKREKKRQRDEKHRGSKKERKHCKVPPDFLCPITQEIMTDPVMALDGHSYERDAIQTWFGSGRSRIKSPLTNETLASDLITPNHTLRKVIQDFDAGSD